MEKMKMKKVESQTVKDKRLGLILMIPIVLVIFIIMGIPLIRAIYWSFTDKVVGSDPNFIGLKNYIGLFQDKVYWKSLRNTAIYTGGCILAKLLLGLLWAALAGRRRDAAVPFGPFLAAGAVSAVCFGGPMIRWYFCLF